MLPVCFAHLPRLSLPSTFELKTDWSNDLSHLDVGVASAATVHGGQIFSLVYLDDERPLREVIAHAEMNLTQLWRRRVADVISSIRSSSHHQLQSLT